MSIKKNNWIRQIDIITDFFYKFLHEKIDFMQPTMFEDSITRVCVLKKALYGVKQSSWVLYQTLLDFFQRFDFHKTETYHCLFVSSEKTMFIVVYINDLLWFDIHIDPQIDYVIQNLQDRFKKKDLGDVSHYFGIEVDVNLSRKKITLWQSIYLNKIFTQYNMTDYRPVKISISPQVNNSLTPYKNQEEKKYHCLILISCRSSHVAGYILLPRSSLFNESTWLFL